MASTMVQSLPLDECSDTCLAPDGDEDAGPAPPVPGACAPLRAEPTSAQVGEQVSLRFDPAVTPGTYSLSVRPWGTVGSLHTVDDGSKTFRCDAPGVADITLTADGCDQPSAVRVTCRPQPGSACCSIDPLDDGAARCAQLGGSPPCFVGCDCLRNGGVYYTETDPQGCLQWQLRPTRDSAEHLVCLDEAGNESPDPRNAQ